MRLPDRLGFRGQTLSDWLQLLIVPAILIAVTFAWSATQTRSNNKREERRTRRTSADRRIAAIDRAEQARQDATLQTYLSQMSGLMLHEKLLDSQDVDVLAREDRDPVKAVARTVTLATLRRLDGERRGEVVRFLYESVLLKRKGLTIESIVALYGADLRRAGLRNSDLAEIDLTGADLRRADLRGANLREAWFAEADLRGADFRKASLPGAIIAEARLGGAKLGDAFLFEADLADADLTGADLHNANFGDADLSDATLTNANLTKADLFGASFKDADLAGADLTNANLRKADLTGASLRGARLQGADLRSAKLAGAKNLNLGDFIAELPRWRQKTFLDAQKTFLDSLSPAELAKFNLTPEKLATFRREANGG